MGYCSLLETLLLYFNALFISHEQCKRHWSQKKKKRQKCWAPGASRPNGALILDFIFHPKKLDFIFIHQIIYIYIYLFFFFFESIRQFIVKLGKLFFYFINALI